MVNRSRQIRLRQSGEGTEAAYFLTVKDEQPGAPRMETELPLSKEQFVGLWPLTLGQRLEKVRSYHALGSLIAEVDTYRAPHEGLVVVEVEFPDLETSRRFIPPAWFGEEITGQPRYSNLVLAGAVAPGESPTTI
jgi:CYTH domain-containing protein